MKNKERRRKKKKEKEEEEKKKIETSNYMHIEHIYGNPSIYIARICVYTYIHTLYNAHAKLPIISRQLFEFSYFFFHSTKTKTVNDFFFFLFIYFVKFTQYDYLHVIQCTYSTMTFVSIFCAKSEMVQIQFKKYLIKKK